MSGEGKRLYRDDKAFWDAFGMFNALYGPEVRWQTTTARKSHCDLFGDTIEPGELYFKKVNETRWDAIEKISRSSMESVVFLVLSGNRRLIDVAADQIEKEREFLRSIAES